LAPTGKRDSRIRRKFVIGKREGCLQTSRIVNCPGALRIFRG